MMTGFFRHSLRWLALPALAIAPGRLAPQEPPPADRRIAVDYSVARFDGSLDPWHLLSAEALHRSGWGAVIARATLARRFGQTGEQVEVEAYPRLGQRAYAYLNLGYSPSGLFPESRYGAEIFAVVRPGLEASAGARHLDFDAQAVTLYTASVGAYLGKFYLVARPFVSPRDGELLASAIFTARRYLGDETDQWVALVVGGGEVPGEETTAFELERLGSRQALLEGRTRLTDPLGVRWSTGYEWEELPGDQTRRRFTLGLGLEARF